MTDDHQGLEGDLNTFIGEGYTLNFLRATLFSRAFVRVQRPDWLCYVTDSLQIIVRYPQSL